MGTYECLATKDYCREGVEPKVPAVLFAIDVSYPMMKEGIVQLICSNMKEMLKHLPRDMNCDKVLYKKFWKKNCRKNCAKDCANWIYFNQD